ncbi:MAG TPA: ATP-binding protein [Polyangiaceae bacterium]
MLRRRQHLAAIREALDRSRIVVLVGPRQCGKTTLARELVPEDAVNYFDLEDPGSLSRLDEPMTTLAPLRGLVVLDEIQRRPELFPTLRVLVDRKGCPAQFLVLGSASGDLMQQSSESLAGRMERVSMSGFSISETGAEHEQLLWLRGGFPLAYLAPTHKQSMVWRKQFIQTILERDLPQWGVRVGATALRRFWLMVAHYHGQIWSSAEPARALGVNESTVRRYLDLLTDAQMLRQLQPYHANVGKRQVKSPKVYVRDSGLFHQLMGLDTEKALLEHPKSGASWEGFVLEQILSIEPHDDVWFWATHQGAELDLVLLRDGKLFGVEIKRTDTPKLTPSIRNALQDLKLERVAIVHPGAKRYALEERVQAVPLASLGKHEPLFP